MKHSDLTSKFRRAALIVGLVLITPLLSACTQEDIDWLFEIGEEWGRANGVIDDAGNISLPTRLTPACCGFQRGLGIACIFARNGS